jgi:hypothetical protein
MTFVTFEVEVVNRHAILCRIANCERMLDSLARRFVLALRAYDYSNR